MREVPGIVLDALAGSAPDVALSCDAVYEGEVVASDLEVSSWSMSWRMGDQQMVQGQASFTVVDSDGRLAPWGFDEPLSVAGSRVRSSFDCAGESVPLGEWLIGSNSPNESWRLSRNGVRWVNGGATVPVSCNDLSQLLSDDKFMAPESPVFGGTVFSEILRLCDGIIGVEFRGVTDMPVPRTMVYREERINTVADLARMVGDYRMTGAGVLEVFDPSRPEKPHWVVEPGDKGTLITVNRSQSRDDIYNAVVATGQTEEGKELREYATTKTGPTRFDGPMGRKPLEVSATATTSAGVKDEAQKVLAERAQASTTMLEVHCVPNPLYEVGDWGVIAQPVVNGETVQLVGRCVEIEMSGGTGGVADMKLSMECSTTDVVAVARHVRREAL